MLGTLLVPAASANQTLDLLIKLFPMHAKQSIDLI